ncbi:MAG: hypothetical protein QW273_00860 [Candidatus Pacearchaeota archaeon]
MKTKKGVSEIVSTVLIVMIAVAAIGIIGAIVIPMVKNSLSTGQACFRALSDISINQEKTCINKTSGNLTIVIKKGAEESVKLRRVDVIITKKDGSTEKKRIERNNFDLNSEVVEIVSVSDVNSTTVAIAPVLEIGNQDKTCDISNTVPLRECI